MASSSIDIEAMRAAMMEELGNKRVDTLPIAGDDRGHRAFRDPMVDMPPRRVATAAQNNKHAAAWANAIQDGQFDDLEAHGVKDLDDLGGARVYAQTTAFLSHVRSQPQRPFPGFKPQPGASRHPRGGQVPFQGQVGRLGGLVPDGGRIFKFGPDGLGGPFGPELTDNARQKKKSPASAAKPAPKANKRGKKKNRAKKSAECLAATAAAAAASTRKLGNPPQGAVPVKRQLPRVPPHLQVKPASPPPVAVTAKKTPVAIPPHVSAGSGSRTPATSAGGSEVGIPITETRSFEDLALEIGAVVFESECVHLIGSNNRICGRVTIKLAMDSNGNPADGVIIFERTNWTDPAHEKIKTCGGCMRNGKTVGVQFSPDRRYIVTFESEETALQFRSAVIAAYQALRFKSAPAETVDTKTKSDAEKKTIIPATVAAAASADGRLNGSSKTAAENKQPVTAATAPSVAASTTSVPASATTVMRRLDVPIPELTSMEEGINMAEQLFTGAPVPKQQLREVIGSLVGQLVKNAMETAASLRVALDALGRTPPPLMHYCKLSFMQWYNTSSIDALQKCTPEERNKAIGAFLAMIHAQATQQAEVDSPEARAEAREAAGEDNEEDGSTKMDTDDDGEDSEDETETDRGAEANANKRIKYQTDQLLALRGAATPAPAALKKATFLPQRNASSTTGPAPDRSGSGPRSSSVSTNPAKTAMSAKPVLTPVAADHVDWLFQDPSTQVLGPGGRAAAVRQLANINKTHVYGGTRSTMGGWEKNSKSMYDFPTKDPPLLEPYVPDKPAESGNLAQSSRKLSAMSDLESLVPAGGGQKESAVAETPKFVTTKPDNGDESVGIRVAKTRPGQSSNSQPASEADLMVRVKLDSRGRIESVLRVLTADSVPAAKDMVRDLQHALGAMTISQPRVDGLATNGLATGVGHGTTRRTNGLGGSVWANN